MGTVPPPHSLCPILHSGAELKENEKTDTRQNLDKTVLEIEKMQIIFKNNFKKTIKQKS